MISRVVKLGLGTVQFGLDYGISNSEGRTDPDEASRVVACAAESGIRTIDTAASYGDSETVLGNVLPSEHTFDIVTKTAPLRTDVITESDLAICESAFHQSIRKLRVKSVYGLLIHNVRDIECDGATKLIDLMRDLRESGLVKKTGLSIYNAEQLDSMPAGFPLDVVQLPINVLDQRLLRSGHLRNLKERGIEIHARSAFLQGLLLMDPRELPERFESVRNHLFSWHACLKRLGITPLKAALDFVLSIEEVDRVIVGVENITQLEEIIEAAKNESPLKPDYGQWHWPDSEIIDPTRWKAGTYDRADDRPCFR